MKPYTRQVSSRRAVRRVSVRQQRGVLLLEALVAMVIFSIGVLGLVALQIASTRNLTDSNFRSDALVLGQAYIAKLRVASTAPCCTSAAGFIASGYASTSLGVTGTPFNDWVNTPYVGVGAKLPGGTGSPTAPAVPTVAFLTSPSSGKTTVNLTMKWLAPGDHTARKLDLRTEL